MSEIAIHCRVEGRVQGVGFRYSARAVARELGVVGWARNRADGSVEVVTQGQRDAVDGMLSWLNEGPVHGTVAAVESTTIDLDPALSDFEIRH